MQCVLDGTRDREQPSILRRRARNLQTDRQVRTIIAQRHGNAALIEDIHERSLDKNVLVVVMGEFGRTPQIFYDNGRPGRGHHPGAMSFLVSGGGFKMGQVIGDTDARGENAKSRPLHPTMTRAQADL